MKHFSVFLVLLIVAFAGCGREDLSSNGRSAGYDSIAHPDSEVSGVTIYLYNRGRVTAEIVADKILKFATRDSTMAYSLDVDSFDSLGHVTTEVTGDSAIIRENDGFMTIFGNVVVNTEDGMHLETDLLHWNSQDDRIYTDAFVRITTNEETLRGWGMEADQRLRRYKILHQVSGELEDAQKLKESVEPADPDAQ